jgi:TolB-like protein
MDGCGVSDNLLFDGFRFDRRGGCLFRLSELGIPEPLPLGSRSLRLLGVLLERQGELVSKDAIMEAVWPGRVVEEANLNVQISKLRHLLDLGREHGSCIQTVPGYGYRFVVPVSPAEPDIRSFRSSIPQRDMVPRPRLSIVVLPFANISGGPEQQYFADGIAEDLATDLSRIEDMFVISRPTAFTYRNKAADAKQIGRELGVRYALEGSVRRLGDQIRVNAQLINAETDAQLWAERLDCEAGDTFDLQNEITSRIAVGLDRELIAAEASRPTDHPDALDCILRGRATILWSPPTPRNRIEAISFLEHALAIGQSGPGGAVRVAATSATVRSRTAAGSGGIDIGSTPLRPPGGRMRPCSEETCNTGPPHPPTLHRLDRSLVERPGGCDRSSSPNRTVLQGPTTAASLSIPPL